MERIEKLKEFLQASPNDNFLKHALALEYIKINDDQQARELFENILSGSPDYIGNYYDLAVVHSLAGNNAEAIKALESALKAGYKSYDWMQVDYELQNLHDKPEFIAFLKKHKIPVMVKK